YFRLLILSDPFENLCHERSQVGAAGIANKAYDDTVHKHFSVIHGGSYRRYKWGRKKKGYVGYGKEIPFHPTDTGQKKVKQYGKNQDKAHHNQKVQAFPAEKGMDVKKGSNHYTKDQYEIHSKF
ncbi:hypothetical protein SMA90_29040, partial [Escherichia coli]